MDAALARSVEGDLGDRRSQANRYAVESQLVHIARSWGRRNHAGRRGRAGAVTASPSPPKAAGCWEELCLRRLKGRKPGV